MQILLRNSDQPPPPGSNPKWGRYPVEGQKPRRFGMIVYISPQSTVPQTNGALNVQCAERASPNGLCRTGIAERAALNRPSRTGFAEQAGPKGLRRTGCPEQAAPNQRRTHSRSGKTLSRKETGSAPTPRGRTRRASGGRGSNVGNPLVDGRGGRGAHADPLNG